MTLRTYGFSDGHGTLITYQQYSDAAAAERAAQKLANARGESISYWLDERDPDTGELPDGDVVDPAVSQ